MQDASGDVANQIELIEFADPVGDADVQRVSWKGKAEILSSVRQNMLSNIE
jgi:hypothetical protein